MVDCIVVGVGGMGAATVLELARRGLDVLGVEQFDIAHGFGSSHGVTRIIRTAYFEDPAYVPLVREAFGAWRELEQLSGKTLLTPSACLSLGLPESELLQGVLQAAKVHHLAVEQLDHPEVIRRFPAFEQIPSNWVGVLEHEAGGLAVEESLTTQVDEARRLGARVHVGEAVLDWTAGPSGIQVQTDHAQYDTECLVLTVGPWLAGLVAELALPLTLMRQVATWFAVSPTDDYAQAALPIFIADTPGGYFYGFPLENANRGLKLARHYGGTEHTSPGEIPRTITDADIEQIRSFIQGYLRSSDFGSLNLAQVCTYTMTPDHHFLVDRHPESERVILAGGFSGHGFKFTPIIARMIAELVTDGAKTSEELFQLKRFCG